MQPIRINRDADIDLRQLPSGDKVAVVDNFLNAPGELCDYAARRGSDFAKPAKSYPGIVLGLEDGLMGDVYRFIRARLSGEFSFLRGGATFSSLLSMTTLKSNELSNLQRLCHTDPPRAKGRLNFAFVLYLFDNDALGGTGFYRWKERDAIVEATALEQDDPARALAFLKERFPSFREPPGYLTETNEIAERLAVIPAKFNRLLFYSGDIPHSAHITAPELLTADFATGRLTLNCFASLRPNTSL